MIHSCPLGETAAAGVKVAVAILHPGEEEEEEEKEEE